MKFVIQTKDAPTGLFPPPETETDGLTAVPSGPYSPPNINHSAPLLVATGALRLIPLV